MQTLKKQLTWLAVWGIAFAAIEAAVVVYLRKIYFPEGFFFPPLPSDGMFVQVEVFRELATLVIMWAVAELIRDRFTDKLAVFMVLFGIWDIFYYVFLKLFIHWPETLGSWDVLFLIPVVWIGPVWAPALVSVFLITAGIIGLFFRCKEMDFQPPPLVLISEIVSMLLIVLSFLIPGFRVTKNTAPESYPWGLLGSGLLLGLSTFGFYVYRVWTGVKTNAR